MTPPSSERFERRLAPSLTVARLRIERNGVAAYDEVFHKGVNILRGDNASGKSTILNFLFFGLGGDLHDWSDAARRCTHVFVEVELNGNIATFSREVSQASKQPMDVFAGAMANALNAAKAEWVRYPYSRSANVESYSQAILRLLGIPEVRGSGSETVTIHQMLRLLYADQLSPIESIFKFERFDPPTLREAVGRLLCGAYDNEMYQNELKIRESTKEFDSVSGELRSLLSILGAQGDGMTLSWVNSERQTLLQRREALRKETEAAEKKLYANGEDDALTLNTQRQAYELVQKLQTDILSKQTKADELKFATADSKAFISSLERKLNALKEASGVAEYVVEVHFDSCPACLAPLEAQDSDAHVCHLCKTEFDSERAKGRLVALMNDTAIQLRQSMSLQTHREREIENVTAELNELEQNWRRASERLTEVGRLPSSSTQEAIRELSRRGGYLDREIEDLERRVSIAMMVEDLSVRKATLNANITRLKDENEARSAAQKKRLSTAYVEIESQILALLHKDLPRQDTFITAKRVEFDFGANQISVDGITYFSASSRVILKSSFFIGFAAAATQDKFFRHPRFCMIDTIEDKGMEVVRSHNFQRLIVGVSEKAEVEHQIIFATAMIAPELDDERFTVGKFSTREDPTLSRKVLSR